MHSNPTARHYQNVAQRRASRARNNSEVQVQGALRAVVGRLNEEEEERERLRNRPLEDPYLVGEEAAATARRERLARESGEDILIREDQRWDWFLGKPFLCCFSRHTPQTVTEICCSNAVPQAKCRTGTNDAKAGNDLRLTVVPDAGISGRKVMLDVSLVSLRETGLLV